MIEATTMKVNREYMEVEDSFYPQKRENVLTRIMTNLVRSGVLLPGETHIYRDHFTRYDWNELLQILDESNKRKAAYDSVIS